MSVFGERTGVVDQEQEVRQERFSRRRSTVTAENEPRRRKKEPPKPWTKKERYLVLYVLLFTVVISSVLALSAREWKLPGFPRISMPTIKLFEGGTIVIEGDGKAANSKLKAKSEKIVEEFKKATSNLSGVYSLYVVDLRSGFSFGVYEDEIFQAASLIKLPVIATAYIESESSKIDLDSKYTLRESDKMAGAGSLYSKPAGYEITYRNMLSLMGKQSDNTAFNIVRKKLGDQKISETATKLGMKNTSLDANETTPKEIGTYFEDLWKGNIMSNQNKEEVLNSITDTLYENWLKEGVEEGVRVAHKYGREVHVVNDAGIVYGDSPYVVVIMSRGVVETEADDFFPILSAIVYNNLEK